MLNLHPDNPASLMDIYIHSYDNPDIGFSWLTHQALSKMKKSRDYICDCENPNCVVALQITNVDLITVARGYSYILLTWSSIVGFVTTLLEYPQVATTLSYTYRDLLTLIIFIQT